MVQWSENRHGVHFLLLSFGISKDVEFVLSFRSISVIDMISSFFEFSAVDEAIVIFSVPEKNRGRLASLEFFALRKRVEYIVVEGKPFVTSLGGLEDNPETGTLWFVHLRPLKSDGQTELMEQSPVDLKLRPNQENILWYKPGPWNPHLLSA
ncbi:uncharacterized protein NPIL_405961 [Nephila pilipes]|uniref:Uncharacterized protein n=1 Tax=Nephila pilipes TaxID=299642 RepID=A0A8X6NZE3_NEPPI|nr:uncharacterized protein NPIL_405961 [Nephila pilipes]